MTLLLCHSTLNCQTQSRDSKIQLSGTGTETKLTLSSLSWFDFRIFVPLHDLSIHQSICIKKWLKNFLRIELGIKTAKNIKSFPTFCVSSSYLENFFPQSCDVFGATTTTTQKLQPWLNPIKVKKRLKVKQKNKFKIKRTTEKKLKYSFFLDILLQYIYDFV